MAYVIADVTHYPTDALVSGAVTTVDATTSEEGQSERHSKQR